jgi:hypothetical protein
MEDELQQFSYTLEPLSEENQVEFLRKFVCLKDWFNETDSKEKEEKKVKLASYAEHLIKQLAQSISDKDKELTGIPLQCRMLADVFDKEFETFCQSAESVPKLPFKLNLLGLYERFMNRKYDIFVEEKSKISMTNVGAKEVRKLYVRNIIVDYQILAVKTLFPEEQVALLQINSQCTSSDEDLTRTGIVQASHDGKPRFLHRTFAEYYVAEVLVNQLTKGSNTSQVQDFMLQKIFPTEHHRVIQAFMDGLLSRPEPSNEPPNEVLKQYGNRISDLMRDGVLAFHQATRERNFYIFRFLLDSVQAEDHTDIVHELLLARDREGLTAWHLAANNGNLQILVKLVDCAEKTLTTEEIVNEVYLAKDIKLTPIWCGTTWNNAEKLKQLWNWGKEHLTTEEFCNEVLLSRGRGRNRQEIALLYSTWLGNI